MDATTSPSADPTGSPSGTGIGAGAGNLLRFDAVERAVHWTNAALFATLLRRTPPSMHGRVNNALIQVSTGLAAVAPLVAGVLVARVSSHWAMGAFAIALGICGVLALTLARPPSGAPEQRSP